MPTKKLLSRFSTTGTRLVILAAMLMTALISSVTSAAAATVPFDLYAVTGTMTLPAGSTSVNVWGYNTTNAAVTRPGGPTLIVNQGDSVQVTLHNGLTEATSLLFQGQAMVPDTTGAAAGGTKTYTFTATQPRHVPVRSRTPPQRRAPGGDGPVRRARSCGQPAPLMSSSLVRPMRTRRRPSSTRRCWSSARSIPR